MFWPQSYFVFVIALVPALVLAIILHEAGHVIAARCAGLPVLAWGVGMRKPWFSFPIWGSIFYFGRPIGSGLTLYARSSFERNPKRDFLFFVGGPLATVLGLGVGLAAWLLGVRSDFLVAWIVISILLTVSSALPVIIRSKGMQLASDAYQLMHLLKHGRIYVSLRLGHALTGSRKVSELMEAIRCHSGWSYCHLHISFIESLLGNRTASRESMAKAQGSALACEEFESLFAYVQALLDIKEHPDNLASVIQAARDSCRDDAIATFWIDCLEAGQLVENGIEASARLLELRGSAIAMDRTDLLYLVDLLEFETLQQEDIELQCRDLLKRHSAQLSTFQSTRLLAVTTERLATAGNVPRARALFAEAQAAIADEASTIDSKETREAYLRMASAPLQKAIAATADGAPIFLQDSTPKQIPRRSAFANATLAMGLIAIVAGFVIRLTVYKWAPGDRLTPMIALVASVVAIVCILSAFVFAIISILRQERQWWRLLISFGLIILVGIVASTIDKP